MSNAMLGDVARTLVSLPELVNNLLLLLSEKEKDVVQKRFALNGHERHTLESIGSEFSVTRERVRQIERTALLKMKRNVFNTSLKNAHDFTSSVLEKNGGLIREDAYHDMLSDTFSSSVDFDPNSLRLSFYLNDDFSFVGNTINFYPYLRFNDVKSFALKSASSKLINKLNTFGDVRPLTDIYSDIESFVKDANLNLDGVRSLIDIDKRLALLEQDMVGLISWRHIYPRTLRDKILYILRKSRKPMHFSEIADEISDAKFDHRSVNIQAIHNELIRHDDFVLIGRGIYALESWGYESGTVEKVIERILEKNGEMSQDDIVKKVLEQRIVKKVTIMIALKNGVKFERVGRNRYSLKK